MSQTREFALSSSALTTNSLLQSYLQTRFEAMKRAEMDAELARIKREKDPELRVLSVDRARGLVYLEGPLEAAS